jgi:ketosteroid isomerase-like protein
MTGQGSRENEELVRFGYDWFNRHREPPPTWHPDGEYINAREDPDHAVYSGIEAIRKQHQGWVDAYPDLHVEPLEIRANGDRVFVWTRFTGHGADSGAAMEMELAQVITLEQGRTRRIQEFFDRAEALRAAGLASAAG